MNKWYIVIFVSSDRGYTAQGNPREYNSRREAAAALPVRRSRVTRDDVNSSYNVIA